MDGLSRLNSLASGEAQAELSRCCGSRRWAEGMAGSRPFEGVDEVLKKARDIWQGLFPEDWREAFRHHPKIGDKESLRKKFETTKTWASGEQSGVQGASDEVLGALAEGNRSYEERFGFIFIVCATGRGAEEMLSILQSRLGNTPDVELRIAAEEQAKITEIRLKKLLEA